MFDNATLPPMSDETKAKLKFPFATAQKAKKGDGMPDSRPCPKCGKHLHRVAAQHHQHGADVGYVCSCGYHEVEFKRHGQKTHTVGHPALTLDSALFVHRQIFKRLNRTGRQGHA